MEKKPKQYQSASKLPLSQEDSISGGYQAVATGGMIVKPLFSRRLIAFLSYCS